MSNRLSSFSIPSAPPPLARYGGRITAGDELPVTAAGERYVVDGSGTVTHLPALPVGVQIFLRFAGASVYVHSSRLICMGAVNFTAAVGDCAFVVSDGNGVWRLYPILFAGLSNALLAQMVQATVKGRAAAAGTGTPVDLTADQIATLIKTGTGTTGVLQSKRVTFTRSMTAATGVVAYTGAGFKPSAIIFIAQINNTASFSVSVVDSGGNGEGVSNYGGGSTTVVTSVFGPLLIWDPDGTAGKSQGAGLSTFDSDGFSLSWTKSGVPAANTANITALCLR